MLLAGSLLYKTMAGVAADSCQKIWHAHAATLFSVKCCCSLAVCPELAASGTFPGIAARLAILDLCTCRLGELCTLELSDALCNNVNMSQLLMRHRKRGSCKVILMLYIAGLAAIGLPPRKTAADLELLLLGNALLHYLLQGSLGGSCGSG